MSIIAAFAVPHPPVIVPAVGQGREHAVQTTVDAYAEVGRRIAALAPDAIVLTSPHAELYLDWFHIAPGTGASGSFARFGAPGDTYHVSYDTAFVQALCRRCEVDGLRAGTAGERDAELDHGTLVPLHFIREAYRAANRPLPAFVRIGLSGMSPLEHYRLGREVAAVADELGRRIVFVASGDLSHKMTADGPYGFAPDGPRFDDEVCRIFRSGDLGELLTMDPGLCERAAECGLRSFQIMAGALDRTPISAELLSHEGTLGVGYGVAAFTPVGPEGSDESRAYGERYRAWKAARLLACRRREGLYVRLARRALEGAVACGKTARPTRDLLVQLASVRRADAVKEGLAVSDPSGTEADPGTTGSMKLSDAVEIDEVLSRRAGCFVSIKKDGSLRGCIGTVAPTRPNLAEEICANALSAGQRDPRFPPVTKAELPELVYDVDVLGEPETVADASALDPARYGVIVTADDGRRGLLLPALDGVDTVERQLQIAASKGGIDLAREHVTLQRFEVVRHL